MSGSSEKPFRSRAPKAVSTLEVEKLKAEVHDIKQMMSKQGDLLAHQGKVLSKIETYLLGDPENDNFVGLLEINKAHESRLKNIEELVNNVLVIKKSAKIIGLVLGATIATMQWGHDIWLIFKNSFIMKSK